MAELNLKQISDKLNNEFVGDERKLVFWYDANADFQDDIDKLELENAKILHLETDNQFYIKYFLECVDTETSYLLYAPFAKPDLEHNHLADTIRYSKEFFADRASLICVDLGIQEKYKPLIQHYVSTKFFNGKERTKKFYAMEIETYNKNVIETAMMCVLCNIKTVSFEEVVRCVLTDEEIEENRLLKEFEKYDLLNTFWKQVEDTFGYVDSEPTLKKFLMMMFVTYTSRTVHANLPGALSPYISYKSGSIMVFMDNLMNNRLYSDRFDELSNLIFEAVNGSKVFSELNIDSVTECNLFSGVDRKILNWMIERLENEDTGAKADDKTIPELCIARRKMHFGHKFENEYYIIENAYYIIAEGKYEFVSGIENIVKRYVESDFKIDRRYRYFYYYYDMTEDTVKYEKLRQLVENIYTNEYLNQITVNWNTELSDNKTGMPMQKDFFVNHVKYAKERTAVIISDAMRYEVAHTLFEKLQSDEKCDAEITGMQGVLPSYTPLGMASLLPHKRIEYTDSYEVLVDGKSCATTEQRQNILQNYVPKSKCIQFDNIKNMNMSELRSVFTGQDVVYIYHNQIDARGDAAKTENEVFVACEEAVNEIHSMIKKISSQANTHHFLVTADHGFIYKRDKLSATDKIGVANEKTNSTGQRYCISNKLIQSDGVCSVTLGNVLGNDDERIVSYPLASDIFKVAGAGQNFVHGGCSPQELIVPVVEVKVERGRKETKSAEIVKVSLTNKITNLITVLDFVQTEPVSDVVKKTRYKVFFITDDDEKISNEIIVNADKKDEDTHKRMFKLKFSLKNRHYDKSQKYYLVIYDENNDIEFSRMEFLIDIAFADDFGF